MEALEEQEDAQSEEVSGAPDSPGESAPLIDDIDAELIARCKAEIPEGTEAFHELLQKYESMVYSTCCRMLGDKFEAEEATQDSFLKVFEKIHQFEGRSTFKTWMFRIVCNACMTRRKKLAKNRERVEAVGKEMKARTNDAHKEAMGPEQDNSEYVDLALSELRTEDREVIALRFHSDLSLEEMADVLKMKLSATKMRLYRAMERFKEVYLTQQKVREEALNGP